MAKRDYYEVLGIDKGADEAAIKKAYRKLAIKYHPDRNQEAGAEDTFKEVSEAYAVLSDTEKRQRYDQYGHAGIDQQYSTEDIFKNANFGDIFGGGSGFESIFDMFFGGHGRGPSRGRDLQTTTTITLEDAFSGTTVPIEYRRLENCDRCKGEGAEPGSKASTCGTCGGQGQVQRQQRTPFGVFSQVGACPACGGAGQTIDNPCHTCKGTGHDRVLKKERVKVPAGIEDGMQVRVSGAGEVGGQGAPFGDLYLEVRIKPHARFDRHGADLLTEQALTIPEAVLGHRFMLDTLDGEVEVQVPKGSETGDDLRLKGHGMPYLRGNGRGDIRVRLRVETPKKLSKKAQSLFEELADELTLEKPGFFGRFRGN